MHSLRTYKHSWHQIKRPLFKSRFYVTKDENTENTNHVSIPWDEQTEKIDSYDVDFTKSPTAWTINRVSDGLEIASAVTSSVIKTSSEITQSGIGIASETVTGILPQVVDIPLPGVVKDTAQIISDTATTNLGAIVGGVQSMGKSVGSIVGQTATETIEMVSLSSSLSPSTSLQNGPDGSNSPTSSPIVKSVGRLAKVSLESFTNVTGDIATATKDVQEKVTNEAIVVVSHVAGNDVGELVKEGVKVTEGVVNLGIKLHTPFITEGNDVLSSLAEDTTKNMGKNMAKKFATEAQKTTLQKLKESTGNQKIDE